MPGPTFTADLRYDQICRRPAQSRSARGMPRSPKSPSRPLGLARFIASNVPRRAIGILESSPHAMPLEDPGRLAAAILHFCVGATDEVGR